MYRKVPARILTVDYVGIHSDDAVRYRRRADQELMKLENQVLRGKLSQGEREVSIDQNVIVKCTVCYNLKQAVIYIGGGIDQKLKEDPCYCCSPCLVAGMIIEVTAPLIDEKPVYEQDEDYFAEIVICQAGSNAMPVTVHIEEERNAGGMTLKTERLLFSKNHGAPRMIDVPFSDYTSHQVGSTVMVLVMPLYGFTDYPGEYMPCINKGQLAEEAILEPYPVLTTDFVNSTGKSCQISRDQQIWDNEVKPYTGDIIFHPFRILPIVIESCL